MLQTSVSFKLPACAVTIRLAPVLPTNVAVVQFPDVRKATEAVIEVMNQGVGIRGSRTNSKKLALTRFYRMR